MDVQIHYTYEMTREFTLRHLIIQDDLTNEDLGVAIIKYGTPGDHIRHWIRFPDGTVRHHYKSKKIHETDADLLIAFDSLPELKVSYRPISEHMYDYDGMYLITMLMFFLVMMACGATALVMTIINMHGGVDMYIANRPIVYYGAIVLLLGTVVSTGMYIICCYIGQPRWSNMTPDDEKMNTLTSAKSEREKIEANDKERLEIRAVLAEAQRARDATPKNKGLTIKVS